MRWFTYNVFFIVHSISTFKTYGRMAGLFFSKLLCVRRFSNKRMYFCCLMKCRSRTVLRCTEHDDWVGSRVVVKVWKWNFYIELIECQTIFHFSFSKHIIWEVLWKKILFFGSRQIAACILSVKFSRKISSKKDKLNIDVFRSYKMSNFQVFSIHECFYFFHLVKNESNINHMLCAHRTRQCSATAPSKKCNKSGRKINKQPLFNEKRLSEIFINQ